MGQQHRTDCEYTQEYVSASVDGELSQVEAARLEAHLAVCDACRSYATNATHISQLLREAPLEELSFPITLPSRRLALARRLQVAAAAAALVATVGLSTVVGSLGTTHASSAGSRVGAAAQRSSTLGSPEAELRMLQRASEARSRLVIHSRLAL
jgi:predicted anti-sigma-YlaC factor YlaD